MTPQQIKQVRELVEQVGPDADVVRDLVLEGHRTAAVMRIRDATAAPPALCHLVCDALVGRKRCRLPIRVNGRAMAGCGSFR